MDELPVQAPSGQTSPADSIPAASRQSAATPSPASLPADPATPSLVPPADSSVTVLPVPDTSSPTPNSIPADSFTDQSAVNPNSADAWELKPPPVPDSVVPSPEATQTPLPTEASAKEGQIPTSQSDINMPPSPDQPSLVQPVSPVDTPTQVLSPQPVILPQSAEIKSEPVEPVQTAPSADPNTQPSSFGSITNAPPPNTPLPKPPESPVVISPPPITQPLPPKPPLVSKPEPVSSFGDLIPNPSDLSEEPALHIDPIVPPQPPQNPEPPLSTEASAEGQTPQPPLSSIDSASHRQKSIQARKQKQEENLSKIVTLVSQKASVNNQDVRDVLHVSQTTASAYLHDLVGSGKLKRVGKAKATKYSLS